MRIESASAGKQYLRNLASDGSLKEGVNFVLLFILCRLALTIILAYVVKGQELSNDALIHLRLIRTPFIQFIGIAPANDAEGAYAPLLPLLEAVFIYPIRYLASDFYAIRLTYIMYETLAAIFFWLTLRTLFPNNSRARYWPLVGFILIPMGWMTTVVMPQDEVISAAFLTLAAWAIALRRIDAAVLVCGLGVICAKIFFIVPLLALILIPSPQGRVRKIIIGFAPILIIYGWAIAAQLLRGNSLFLTAFTPDNSFCINIWAIIVKRWGISLEMAKTVSSVLGFGVGLLTLAVFVRQFNWRSRQDYLMPSPLQVITLMTAMLLWFFALFYLVNPEYYIIVFPLLLLIFRSKIEVLLLFIAMAIPWSVNFFDGVRTAMTGAALEGRHGKIVFIKIYRSLFPASPDVTYEISVWLSVLFTVAIAAVVTRKLLLSARTY